MVAVDEGAAQLAGEVAPDGGLAAARHADQGQGPGRHLERDRGPGHWALRQVVVLTPNGLRTPAGATVFTL
jgi:hypothetical protein